MTMYNTAKADEKEALDQAMAKAAEQIKTLKTFEIKGDPVIEYIGTSKTLAAISIKITGASRNYAQTSQNYLKGECEGNGNAATGTFKKIWKDSHASITTDEASQWIGRAAYDAILRAAGVDIDNAPATIKTNSLNDLELILRLDAKRAAFEEQLKAHASAILSRYLKCVTTQQVMSSVGYKLKWQALDSFGTTVKKTETSKDKEGNVITTEKEEVTITPADQKRKLRYEKAILGQYKALSTIKATAEGVLKNSGDPNEIKAKIEEIEADIPLTEGQVKANEEAEAKAARAAAREDKKADKDAETRANIVKTFEMGAPIQVITMLTKVSQTKAEEILRDAGYDPAKTYAEQGKAKVNVIPGGDKVRVTPIFNNNNVEAEKIKSATAVDKMSANDKDAKLRRTIFNMHSVFTSEEIAKYLDLSEIFVARVLDESD